MTRLARDAAAAGSLTDWGGYAVGGNKRTPDSGGCDGRGQRQSHTYQTSPDLGQFSDGWFVAMTTERSRAR